LWPNKAKNGQHQCHSALQCPSVPVWQCPGVPVCPCPCVLVYMCLPQQISATNSWKQLKLAWNGHKKAQMWWKSSTIIFFFKSLICLRITKHHKYF
jgi:hypothetical protein